MNVPAFAATKKISQVAAEAGENVFREVDPQDRVKILWEEDYGFRDNVYLAPVGLFIRILASPRDLIENASCA